MPLGGDWWRKTELEEARSLDEVATSNTDLPRRIERLERAFQAELTASMSLNIRGTALAAASALAILLLAQFSAIWLDETHWKLTGWLEWIMRYLLLPGSVIALVVCIAVSVVATWPRRAWASDFQDRLQQLGQGNDQKEAALLLGMVEGQRARNERKARILRFASIPLVAAVFCTVAQAGVFALDAQALDPPRTSGLGLVPQPDTAGLPDSEILGQLAEAYAPRVYLHPKEQFGPIEPATFIDASALLWNLARHDEEVAGRGEVDSNRLGAECGDECYSNAGYLARELTRPFERDPDRPNDLHYEHGFYLDPDDSIRAGETDTPEVPVYYEFTPHGKELRITYWFFFGYSRPHKFPGAPESLRDRYSHEGDWENIDVALTLDRAKPVAVYFYGHGHPQRQRWTDTCKLVDGAEDCVSGNAGHPIVYSAWESHASYPTPGGTKSCGSLGCACDLRDQGPVWDSWATDGGLVPVRGEPWYGFGGAWGKVGDFNDTGPLGPSGWKSPSDPDPGDLQSAEPC